MNCQEVQPFVSALYDGESVSRQVADHIRNCPACHARLEDYARMGVAMRLLASRTTEEAPSRLPQLPQLRRRWSHTLTTRVLVPRFALAVGVLAILALSVGLGWVRAQNGGLWFQFDFIDPETHARVGSLIQEGDPARGEYLSQTKYKSVVIQFKPLEIRNDLVRLRVRARSFEPQPASEEGRQNYDEIFANIPLQEFDYVPGQTLEIPIVGGSKVLLKGQVFKIRPSFSAEWFSITPKPDEIVLSKGALVRGRQFLGEIRGSGSAQGTNSSFGICVPPLGAFVFALEPFEGAVEGVAEFGQVRFKMDGDEYVLFSATPITGGQQPREIWVYRSPNCPPSWGPHPPRHVVGVGDVSNVLDALRK